MKLTVFIEGPRKVIDLEESLVITHDNPCVVTKRATIFWNYNNVTSENNLFIRDGGELRLDHGYYSLATFNTVFHRLFGEEIVFYEWNRKCSLSSRTETNLKKLGLLFGFEPNKILPSGSVTEISDNPVDINNGLKYINITCSLVDTSRNIHSGKRSDVIVSLPVGDTVVTKGMVQSHDKIRSEVYINKAVINRIHFSVTNQDMEEINVGSVLLDLYIV